MSNSIKELVARIKKEAAGGRGTPKPPPPDSENRRGGGTVAPVHQPGAGQTNNSVNKNVSSSPIKKMQTAIQNFATTATDYLKEQSVIDPKTRKITYKIKEEDKRRDFNDFLTEQFAATADIKGNEYTTDPSANTIDSKLPTDLIQLNTVLDSLQRIGGAKKESLVDGVWNERTNNAVRNVYAIATALVAAYEALGGFAPNDPNIFKKQDLLKLKNAIPDIKDPSTSNISQDTLSKSADEIAKLVDKLSTFYSYYSKNIIEHPAYNEYIKGDVPLLTVKPGVDPAQLDADEAIKMQRADKLTLPFLKTMDSTNKLINVDNRVSLNYLQNDKTLQELMNLLGYKNNEINLASKRRVVQTLINQINDIIKNINIIKKNTVHEQTH